MQTHTYTHAISKKQKREALPLFSTLLGWETRSQHSTVLLWLEDLVKSSGTAGGVGRALGIVSRGDAGRNRHLLQQCREGLALARLAAAGVAGAAVAGREREA